MKKFILPVVIPAVLTVGGCGGSGDNGNEASPRKSDNKPDTSVVSEARRDALRLSECTSDVDSIAVILDIHAKESLMRAHNLDATADLYIATVRAAATAD